MTGYERMMTAIHHRGVPDKVPIWELIINRPVIKALCPDLLSAEKVARYEWGSAGGFILASSNSIHPAVKPENYKAMVEAGREFGAYPLDADMVESFKNKDYMGRYR